MDLERLKKNPGSLVDTAPHRRPSPLRWKMSMMSTYRPPNSSALPRLIKGQPESSYTILRIYWLKPRKTKHNPKTGLVSGPLLWWPVTPVCPTSHCNSRRAAFPPYHQMASDTHFNPSLCSSHNQGVCFILEPPTLWQLNLASLWTLARNWWGIACLLGREKLWWDHITFGLMSS